MTSGNLQPVTISVDKTQRVSGLLLAPPTARACYVLAHGAGAGMGHPFMASVAEGLTERGVATLRYQFPYMERGSKRPDAPKLAHAAVRAAVAAMSCLAPNLALIAGGKSFGGRMTSQACAASPLPGVRGIAFLGFLGIGVQGWGLQGSTSTMVAFLVNMTVVSTPLFGILFFREKMSRALVTITDPSERP